MNKASLKDTAVVVSAIALCQSAGAIGSVFTVKSVGTWYAGLIKPVFNPPNWVFGPVWVTLYTIMGISLYLVWKQRENKNVRKAICFFAVQLFLNAVWTPVFFGAKLLLPALVIICILCVFIMITITAFAKHSRVAAFLLFPYLLWVAFASVLNFSLWLLNRP